VEREVAQRPIDRPNGRGVAMCSAFSAAAIERNWYQSVLLVFIRPVVMDEWKVGRRRNGYQVLF